MPKLYQRNQGGEARFYGDFRDIGGGQHALVPEGGKRATTDQMEATRLLAKKTLELTGLPPDAPPGAKPTLKAFADRFVNDNPGDVTERWLKETKLRLTRAVQFFGTDRELTSIRPKDVRAWLDQYLHLSNSNQRHHLHALSGLYRYAQELEVVPVGYNPVGGLYRKPSVVKKKQRTEEFFEIDEAARFLAKAIELDQAPGIVATFLLTGGRRSEVLGLLVGDIDFENDLVRIQPNRHRGLKRAWSERVVPLWPQLREMLEPHVVDRDRSPEELLFPGGRGRMITDLRTPLGEISKHLKITTPRLTKFRHTYATARLHTTDNGKQISVWTVAKELGHKTVARVEDTYGHPNHYRPRGEVVEYRLPED
jgi:integrase